MFQFLGGQLALLELLLLALLVADAARDLLVLRRQRRLGRFDALPHVLHSAALGLQFGLQRRLLLRQLHHRRLRLCWPFRSATEMIS